VTKRSPAFLSLIAVSTLVVMSTYACSDTKEPKGGILDDHEGGLIDPGDEGGAGGRPGATASRIGRPCVRDVDCGGQGLTCMTAASSDLGGGGPAGGYCVADCSEDVAICQTLDPNSVCVRFSSGTVAGPAFCLEGCTVGQTTAVATSKCHNRLDAACDDTGAPTPGEGFCRPTCRGDFECGTRKCDLGSGFCVDASEITGTLPIGSPCDPSPPEECAGACFALTEDGADGPGMCAALCTLGSPGCGLDPNSTEIPNAACLFVLTDADGGTGDLGLCGRLCDCDDDCTAYQRACRPWGDAASEEQSGFKGYCGGQFDANGAKTEHIACTGRADAGKPDSGTVVPDSGGPAPVLDSGTD
jgi:hypothetical protein